MNKTIYFSHGDKGGVGKSMLSAIIVDILLTRREMIAILEGDANQPDIVKRFAETGIGIGAINLNRAGDAESAIMKFGEWIEKSDASNIVVNLPAGAGDTIDKLAPVLAEVLNMLNYYSIGFYSMGPTNSSTSSLNKSLEAGLLAFVDKKVVVYPEFLGDPNRFDAKKYEIPVDQEISIPSIRPDPLRDLVLSLDGPFSLLTDSSDLTLVERAMLRRWVDQVHDRVLRVFPYEDHSVSESGE